MKFNKILSGILGILILVSAVSCANNNNSKEKIINYDYKTISIIEGSNLINDENTLFVDLRSEAEYIGWTLNTTRGGHIKGAIDFPKDWFELIDNDDKFKQELERRNISKDKNLVLYSNENVDSKYVNKLKDLGYNNIATLSGGASEWSKDNTLPLEKMSNYELLVYPKWIDDLTNGKAVESYNGENYKIVELSFGKAEADYAKAHIKGAIHVDETLNEIIGLRNLADYEFIPQDEKEDFWNRPDDKTIEKMLLNLGIDKDTLVVIYGPNTTAAARCAVIMRYAGVKDVRILNGGIERWNLDKLPLESGIIEPIKLSNFKANIPSNPNIMIDLEDELNAINDPNSVIASIRSWPEYIGKVSGYTYIGEAGDISNSRFGYAGSDPYHMEDYRNPDNTMFNYHIIAKRWADWGITPDKHVVFHCGTGWRASETYIYAAAMGWNNISVYDGGWYEWHLKKDTPRQAIGIPNDIPYLPIDSTGYVK